MDNQQQGWSATGYLFPTLSAILERYKAHTGRIGQDQHSAYVEIVCE